MGDNIYVHGHHESVLRSHTWRTIENSAKYLETYLTPESRLLDVGCGPGPITLDFAEKLNAGSVIGIDTSEDIIEKALEGVSTPDRKNCSFKVGNAYNLDFDDNSFDVYTISFGIRNVTRPQEALNEAYRVLRPGGRLMVLEFSQLPNPMMQKAYDLYSFNVIPRMGQVIANDRDSYQYLVESIRNFPDQDTFLDMVRAAGFEQAKYRNLTMGIAALHSGWKL